MKQGIRFLVLILLALTSCRKKDFPPDTRSEEGGFYFKADINANPITIKAGESGYYMYTGHTLDTNVMTFTGDLREQNCNACTKRLKITLRDYRTWNPLRPNPVDSSLHTGTYLLSNSPGYLVKFKSKFNTTANTYLWNFGDNSSSTEANPSHVYATAGNYSVSLRVRSNTNCEQYISKIEKINSNSRFYSIQTQTLDATSFAFRSTLSDTINYSCVWNFGDGTTSFQFEPKHQYAIPGTYPVTLKIGDLNDTVTTRLNLATITTPMACLTNYDIESFSFNSNPGKFAGAMIEWTDENGTLYSSYNAQQPNWSQFTVLSVEDYLINEKGEKTKKIKVRFDCEVRNGTSTKQIRNAEAILSVSYPN